MLFDKTGNNHPIKDRTMKTKTMICAMFIAVLTVKAEDNQPNSVNLLYKPEGWFQASFKCNAEKEYTLWGSETMVRWFPIKTIKPGEIYTTLSQVNGEDVVTVAVPKPFLIWSPNPQKGFLRISLNSPPVFREPISMGIVQSEDYFTVSFASEPFTDYII